MCGVILAERLKSHDRHRNRRSLVVCSGWVKDKLVQDEEQKVDEPQGGARSRSSQVGGAILPVPANQSLVSEDQEVLKEEL